MRLLLIGGKNQKQLLQLQREIGFSYVRFHGIFHDDMAVYREDETGEPAFWFGYADSLMDFLLSAGLKPILELGFMPKALARVPDTVFWWHANGSPPKSEQKWCRLVEATLRHFCERYGNEEVRKWYFEVWNEPNLDAFWCGTQAEYFRLYQVTAETVKAVDPRFRVSGPSVSGADFRDELRYLEAFIDFCDKEKLPVDFFSGHPYRPIGRWTRAATRKWVIFQKIPVKNSFGICVKKLTNRLFPAPNCI